MKMRVAVAALAGFSALAAFVPAAQAANRFALVCIENRTNVTLNYNFKWGVDGKWSSRTLAPNAGRAHSWRYSHPDENRSPGLHVSFDSDLSRRMIKQSYFLKARASPQESDCKAYANEYVFVYDGTAKKYIDLKQVNR